MARALVSPLMPGLRGVLGDLVFSQHPDGTQVRRRGRVRVPPTPAKAAQQARMALVSQAWARLPRALFDEWQAYAESQAWRNAATGAIVRPRAYNLYAGLASRARQVDPTLDPTTFAPPTRPFLGDGVTLTILPLGGEGHAKDPTQEGDAMSRLASGPRGMGGGATNQCVATDPTPSTWEATPGDSPEAVLSSPPSADPPPQGEGTSNVTFVASGANAPGVVTELLVQPLVNAYRRSYADKYAGAGFHAFPAAGTVEVPVRAGAVAVAYRFVLAATGQETALVELGTFVVG